MKQCEYSKCGQMFDPKKPKARFCSDKCRVYWNRAKGKVSSPQPVPPKPKPNPVKTEVEIPPMPTRGDGENVIDFVIRKNEWKAKYNQ